MSFKALRPRQAAVPAAALVVGALALSACGGTGSSAASPGTAAGSTSSSTTTTPTTTGGGAAAFAAYSNCLKQHGVTLPNFAGRRPGGGTPPANGGGNPPANATGRPRGGFGGAFGTPAQRKKFQAAQTACAKLRPAGGGFGRGGGRGGFFGGGNNAAFAAYRNCLTIHGVTFGRRTSGGAPAAPNVSTAKMKAALTACATLRPSGFGGRRPPASSSSGSGSG